MAAGRQLSSSVHNLYKLHNPFIPWRWTSTAKVVSTFPVDVLDEFAARLVQEKTQKWRKPGSDFEQKNVNISKTKFIRHQNNVRNVLANKEERTQQSIESNKTIEADILNALAENKHQEVVHLLGMLNHITENTLLKLFTAYSDIGNVEKVNTLQEYSKTLNNNAYVQYGKFDHFVAKVQCLHGNSDKGLSILTHAYRDNNLLRNVYRTIFRDLIQDSVANRSVASLVIFKRYVIEWSELLSEQLPLVCLWHSCWTSGWFSDQQLAEELVDAHSPLRVVIQDRISALMTTSLVRSGEDDSVVRLLQTLLKHQMLEAYEQALQILFDFRLKNEDVRGCTEILRNSETLGLQLSQGLQSKYIHMVINRRHKMEERKVQSHSHNILFKF